MPRDVDELLRQRRLIQEHLAWLDREIAKLEKGTVVEPQLTPGPPPPLIQAPPAAGTKPSENSEADEILTQYQQTPKNLEGDVKRGCITAVVALLLLIFCSAIAVWFLTPHPSPEKRPSPTPAQR
jgi:hypothetical protein